jgi:thioredoxin 1
MKQLIYFSATWCGPCNAKKPMMAEMQNKFNITMIDVDQYPEVAAEYGIRSVPALLLIKNGTVAKQISGQAITAQSVEDLYTNN